MMKKNKNIYILTFLTSFCFLLIFYPFFSKAQEENDSNLIETETVNTTTEEDFEETESEKEVDQEEEDDLNQDNNPEVNLNSTEIENQGYFKAVVIEIIEEKNVEVAGLIRETQVLKIKILDGPEKDKEIDFEYNNYSDDSQKVKEGDKVIMSKNSIGNVENYYLEDTYRLNSLYILTFVFIIFLIIFAKLKGITSLFGLGFSFWILIAIIIPWILDGKDPLLITFLGAVIILIVSIYLSHGFNKLSSVAIISGIVTLCFALAINVLFVHLSHLFGFGSENALFLQVGLGNIINMKGILLSGILIGCLGVIDDITISQAAVVQELRNVNKKLTRNQLYQKALNVGKEHIASMVNTLVLAYAGSSLPLFILLTKNNNNIPFWVTLNSEYLAEEIVRSLVGSLALVLAVPITTFVAVIVFGPKPKKKLFPKEKNQDKKKEIKSTIQVLNN